MLTLPDNRQGVLPFPRFWASTKPFGTPLGPYFVKWLLTIVMIIAPPAGDAFSFSKSNAGMIRCALVHPLTLSLLPVTDLQVYPSAVFSLMLSIGLYLVRWRRKRMNLPRPIFRSWDSVVIFTILVNVFLLVMPFVPPAGGQYAGDVSFWYATYAVTGIGM